MLRLSKPQSKTKKNVISFNNSPVSNPSKCAKLFIQQFCEHPKTNERSIRPTVRKLKHLKTTNPIDSTDELFTNDMVSLVLKNFKNSEAIGPDGLVPIILQGTR